MTRILHGFSESVEVSLLGVAQPLWENISSARYTPMNGSHSGPRG